MMSIDTATEPQLEVKAPSTRLLDLLAGWSSHVSADEENGLVDPELSAEEIASLYQEAGEASEEWTRLGPDAEAEAVRRFVNARVLPLMARGSAAQRPRAAAA
jgi:hypothetical protein